MSDKTTKPDAALAAATTERSALLCQRASIDGRLAEIENFLRLYSTFVEQPAETVQASRMTVSAQARPSKGVGQSEFNAQLRAILDHARMPLTFGQIRQRLGDRGISIGGKNESRNLSTKLWNAVAHGEFARLPDNGYWLAEGRTT